MKLLLTSNGLSNESLRNALKEMIPGKIKIAFIPTACNIEEGEKDWLINDYVNCKKVGTVDIVDISAVSKDVWLPRLEAANVLFFGGGNTFHLMYWVKKSGLDKILPELLKTRIYVGISAGSMITCKDMSLSSSKIIYGEKSAKEVIGLNYVPFYIKPHYNSSYFPKVRDEYLIPLAKELSSDLYALDDQSGIKVVNGKIEVISEGKWKKF